MHNPADFGTSYMEYGYYKRAWMYVPAYGHEHGYSAGRAEGADPPPRASRLHDGDRGRPALVRRRAHRARRVDDGDGPGGHRQGNEARGYRRSRLRIRP